MNETSTNNASKDSFSVDERFYEEPFAVMVARLSIEVTLRVPNRFFGILDLAYLKAGIRDFGEKEERNSCRQVQGWR